MEAAIIQFKPSNLSKTINHEEPLQETLMVDFIRLQLQKNYRTDSYRAHCDQIIKKLNTYSELINEAIYTFSISDDFLRSFDYFLREQKLRPNTIQGLIQGIKTHCKKAGNYGYRVHPTFDEYRPEGEKAPGIALNMCEITRIFYFDKLTIPQKKIRDLFIIGCLTGLRYSDYSRLTPDNIHDDILSIKTKKTGAVVHIPLHPYVKEAIARHKGKIPAVGLSISYFNRYVKLICEKVGLTEYISHIRQVGFDTVTETNRKCDLLGTHTARRSFATIMYNSGKFTTAQIMLVTGHSSEKSFFRYIKINPEDNAKLIAANMKLLS